MVRQLLSRERDVDTAQAIRSAVLELDRIQVAMETVSSKYIKPQTRNSNNNYITVDKTYIF